jgi:hypothetical protein
MRKYIKLILVLLIISLALTSCSGGGVALDKNEVFQISSGTLELTVGTQQKISAKSNLTDTPNVTWQSANPTVATVDENGVVSALSIGTSTISAKSENGSIKYCVVNVIGEKYEFDQLVEFTIQNLPKTVKYYSKHTGKLITECVIEKFSLKTYEQSGAYIVYIILEGTKTYDADGDDAKNPIFISTSLYRENGENCNVNNFKKDMTVKVGDSFSITLDPFQVLISYENKRTLELKIDDVIEQ